jgi:TRAP transporter 4TM/12TM fusion protein
LPKAECPSAVKALTARWHLVLPLIALVWLLFAGYTPLFAGTLGMALTAVLILGSVTTRALRPALLRIAFWVGVGLLAAVLGRGLGLRVEVVALALVGMLVAITLFLAQGRAELNSLLTAMADAAKNALPVGIACALVGILIGVSTLTGLASDIARVVLLLAGDNLLLALLLTMVACLVLGIGLPTIPNYIITSAMAAPALLEMGVPLMVSHMFCFYFGIMADLTPPVALAALAAQAIAKVSHIRIGFIATKIALAGYVVPFMAVYAPALMLQEGSWLESAYVFGKALLALGLWGAVASNWLKGRLRWFEHGLATAAAALLVVALPITDELGFALAAAFIAVHWRRHRGKAPRSG